MEHSIALVTGATSGLGYAAARLLTPIIGKVFTRKDELTQIREKMAVIRPSSKAVAAIGRNVTGVKTDISKLDDLDRVSAGGIGNGSRKWLGHRMAQDC